MPPIKGQAMTVPLNSTPLWPGGPCPALSWGQVLTHLKASMDTVPISFQPELASAEPPVKYRKTTVP